MATVHVDPELYRRLRSRAEATGSSVEADVHRILDEQLPAAGRDEGERRRRALDDLIALMQAAPVELPEEAVDTTEMIRQMREEEESALVRVVRGDR